MRNSLEWKALHYGIGECVWERSGLTNNTNIFLFVASVESVPLWFDSRRELGKIDALCYNLVRTSYKSLFGEMFTAPYLSFLSPCTMDGNMVTQNHSPYWCQWVKSLQVTCWKILCVHARSMGFNAQQCVHFSNRLVMKLAVWLHVPRQQQFILYPT